MRGYSSRFNTEGLRVFERSGRDLARVHSYGKRTGHAVVAAYARDDRVLTFARGYHESGRLSY